MEPVGKVIATFDAPIGEVWAVIAAIGAEKAWIEGVQACSLQGAGQGAFRTLTMPDFIAVEKIEECDPERYRVVYRLQDSAGIPVKGAFGTMQLTAMAPDRTRLDWLSYAETIDGDIASMQARITEMYAKSVDNIKRLIGCS